MPEARAATAGSSQIGRHANLGRSRIARHRPRRLVAGQHLGAARDEAEEHAELPGRVV